MKTSSRLAVACAAMTVMLAPGIAGMGTANAAPGPAATNPALINADANTRLTINKYLGGVVAGQPNDGRALADTALAGVQKLSGVKFDIYQVGKVDLKTNAGWEAAKALKALKITSEQIKAGKIVVSGTEYPLTKRSTVTTTNGKATFDGKVGLYLVVENLANSTSVTDAKGTVVDKARITPSSPFLVTLPLTDPVNQNAWLYDVNVYPKNTADSITKDVLDADTIKVGGDLTYRLLSTVSPAENADALGYYYIGDALNPYVTFKSVSAKLVTVDAAGRPAGDVSTLKGCSATATTSVSACDFYWYGNTTGAAPVKLVFSTLGLGKLATNQKTSGTSLRVQTDILATVTSLPDDGLVKNRATFIPSKPWWEQAPGTTPVTPPGPDTPPGSENPPPGGDTPPGIPSNEVVSKFGDIVLRKTNDTKAANLTGAEFSIFRATNPNTCSTTDVQGDPVQRATATPSNGLYKFSGLQLSNWVNDSSAATGALAESKYRSYCIVETKAPEGYELLAQPIMVNLLQNGKLEVVEATTWTTLDATKGLKREVVNMTKNLGNKLPNTGAFGAAPLGAAGLLLVAGGLGVAAVSSRRKRSGS